MATIKPSSMQRRRFVIGSTLAGFSAALTGNFTASADEQVNKVLTPQGSDSQAQAPSWSNAAPMPINTQELYPAVHKGKLYVAGGIAAEKGNLYFTDRIFSYDDVKNHWADEARLPKPLHHAALVSIKTNTQDRLFLVGGFHGSESHFWRMQNEVYELVEGEWHASLNLPSPQAEGVLAAHQSDIHLVSGQSPKGKANSQRSDHQEVSRHLIWQAGANKWEQAAPIPLARNSATGGWIDDQLIVTGGRNAAGNFADTHIYDKKEDRWRDAAPMPLPQAGTASVVDQQSLIVFGGEIFTPKADVFKHVWRYNLARDQWQPLPDLITPRHGLGAGKLNGRAYVVGGATQPSGVGTSNVNEVLAL